MGERGRACGCSVLPGSMATGKQRAPVGSLSCPGARSPVSRGRPWVLCHAQEHSHQEAGSTHGFSVPPRSTVTRKQGARVGSLSCPRTRSWASRGHL